MDRIALVTGANRGIGLEVCRQLARKRLSPGWVATDLNNPGGRPVPEGAAGIVWAATLPDDGPTGGFFRDEAPLEW